LTLSTHKPPVALAVPPLDDEVLPTKLRTVFLAIKRRNSADNLP